MVSRAVDQGGSILTGGRRPDVPPIKGGYWYLPTVLSELAPSMDVVRQEVFGPIASVLRFSEFDDVLAQANDSDYGLSAYLFTNDYRRVMRAVSELEFGEVFVNRVGPEAVYPYHSGYRLSGIGGDDGRHGFDAYLRMKTVYLGCR